jgi:inorganic pyrophosphatase
VEISKESKVKYELDKKTGLIKVSVYISISASQLAMASVHCPVEA